MSAIKEIEPELAGQLAALREQPVRDAQKAANGRAAFLAQAQDIVSPNPLPVSVAGDLRHNSWKQAIQSFFTIFRKKEHSPMFGTLGTILLVISLALGGGGVTVAVAQNSLPDQVLYPVKSWSEDVRLGLTIHESSQLQLALELSSRRAEEIAAMIRSGQTPPEAVQARMQVEIEKALQLAAGLPDQTGIPALKRIQQQLQAQEQVFTQLGTPADSQANAALQRTRVMVQEHLQLCTDGIADPAYLREQLRERSRVKYHVTPSSPAFPLETQNSVENPWTTGTPTPGSDYGPGPGDGNGSTATPGPNRPDNGGGGTGTGGGNGTGGGTGVGGGK